MSISKILQHLLGTSSKPGGKPDRQEALGDTKVLGVYSSERNNTTKRILSTAICQLGFHIFYLKHNVHNKATFPVNALSKGTAGFKTFFLKIIIW